MGQAIDALLEPYDAVEGLLAEPKSRVALAIERRQLAQDVDRGDDLRMESVSRR